MPTITISLPSYVTEVEAQPFPADASDEVAQTVTLTAGAGSIVVAASDADWCWRFTEHGPGYSNTRFAAVAGSVAYASLVDLDPGTLVAAVVPADPAWEATANAAIAAAANVTPTIAGGALGIVTHIGARTKTAILATLDAAEALGRGMIVFFPGGANYDVGSGLSLSGYSCQIRGAGAHMLDSMTPAGTVFYASSQSGPVLDFKGWVAPVQFSGRVRHGDFAVRGSGVADATKLNSGIRVDLIMSTTFSDIAIMNTGGPGLRITADVAGYACYLSDFERITIRTPISAKTNDVPYLWATEANGNRFRGIGFISRLSSADCGVSGAVVIDGSATYPSHDNKFDAPWFENLHVPTGGCLISNAANANIFDDAQFFDVVQEVGASGTAYYRLLNATAVSTGGNVVRGVIPGDNNGAGNVVPLGVDIQQSGNVVDGSKGYRGGNVQLASGVGNCTVWLKGAQANANTPGWFDNSGQTSNHLVDSCARREVVPSKFRTTGQAGFTDLGSVSGNIAVTLTNYASGFNVVRWTMTGATTLTAINAATAGDELCFLVRQDATGGRTMSWPATFKWAGGSAPTLTATANKADSFRFAFDGTNWFELSRSMNM